VALELIQRAFGERSVLGIQCEGGHLPYLGIMFHAWDNIKKRAHMAGMFISAATGVLQKNAYAYKIIVDHGRYPAGRNVLWPAAA
jgi:hypothetical protein